VPHEAENENVSTPTSGRLAGAALIAGAVGFIVTMSIHPSGVHLDSAADLASQAMMTRLAHGIALVALPLSVFGMAEFSRRSGFGRAWALAGFVFYALACIAVMNAGLMSGFVQAELMDRYAGADAAARASIPPLMSYTHMLNQAWAMVFSAGSAAAIGIWSLGLQAMKRERVLGWLGVAVALGLVALLAFGGHDALSVHGYMLTALGQGAWMVGVGLLLWRGWNPEQPSAT
jgi:hypothetical protein